MGCHPEAALRYGVLLGDTLPGDLLVYAEKAGVDTDESENEIAYYLSKALRSFGVEVERAGGSYDDYGDFEFGFFVLHAHPSVEYGAVHVSADLLARASTLEETLQAALAAVGLPPMPGGWILTSKYG